MAGTERTQGQFGLEEGVNTREMGLYQSTVVDTAMLPVVAYVERSLNQMQPAARAEMGLAEKGARGRLVQALLARISYITPLTAIAATVDAGRVVNNKQTELSLRERKIYRSIRPIYFGGKVMTLDEIAQLPEVVDEEQKKISKERVRQLDNKASSKLRTVITQSTPVFEGERPLEALLEENMDLLSKQPPSEESFTLAPAHFWDGVDAIMRLSEREPSLLSYLPVVHLRPPYDYLFAREVLEPVVNQLSPNVREDELRAHYEDIRMKIRQGWEQFYATHRADVGTEPVEYRSVTTITSPAVAEEPDPRKTPFKMEDFGITDKADSQGVEFFTTLGRRGLTTPEQLLSTPSSSPN